MPTPADSLQSTGHSSAQQTKYYPSIGDIWNFQQYTTPVSARGKGGWNYDPVAQTRVKAADEQTRNIVEQAQQQRAQTRRQVVDQMHKPTAPDSTRLANSQASYLARLSSFGNTVTGSDWWYYLMLAVGLLAVYMIVF